MLTTKQILFKKKNCLQPLTNLELIASARGKKGFAFGFSLVFYQIFS